jgi:hypothetical protein
MQFGRIVIQNRTEQNGTERNARIRGNKTIENRHQTGEVVS